MKELTLAYEVRIRRNRERRNRELRRHLAMIAVSAGLALSVTVFALGSTRSDASDSAPCGPYKYYRSIAVLPDDTIESLAQKSLQSRGDAFDEADSDRSAYEIRFINHLDENEVPLAGTTIIIPYYSNELR